MKLIHVLLIALVALALHMAWTGIVAPALASSRSRAGGEVHSIAAGNAGAGGGDVYHIAGSNTVRAGQETN